MARKTKDWQDVRFGTSCGIHDTFFPANLDSYRTSRFLRLNSNRAFPDPWHFDCFGTRAPKIRTPQGLNYFPAFIYCSPWLCLEADSKLAHEFDLTGRPSVGPLLA